jgi:nitrogen fixation NifU-like protein
MNDEFRKKFDPPERRMMNELRSVYSKKTIAYSMAPVNLGRIENPDGHAKITGPCGDTMEVYLKCEDGRVKEAAFLTDGCGATLACGSAVTELAAGKSIQDILKISPADVLEFLGGLPENHIHCSILSVNTLHAALGRILLSGKNLS